MKALSLVAALLLALVMVSCDRNELYDIASMAADEEDKGITSLRVTDVQLTSISFEWDPVDGATAYRLYRSSDAEFTAPVIEMEDLITAFNLFGTIIEGGVTFYYRVGVVLSTGEEFSNTVEARTGTLPAAPNNLRIDMVTTNSVSLAWDTVPGADSYVVHRTMPTGLPVTVTDTTYNDPGLSSGNPFSYYVTAHNEFGESAQSNTVSGSTGMLPGATDFEYVTPSPTITSEVSLKWTPASNAQTYKVYRDSGPTPIYETDMYFVYTDMGLAPGSPHTYKVCAHNDYGDGPCSPEWMVTTGSIPGTPGSIMMNELTSRSDMVELSWTPAPNADSFRVERSNVSETGPYSTVVTTAALSYTDSPLAAGVTYYYRVIAINGYGESVAPSPVLTLDTFTRVSRAEVTGMTLLAIPFSYGILTELPVGSIFVFMTNGGLYGKFIIQNDVFGGDTTLIIKSILFNMDGTVGHTYDSISIEDYNYCDLDDGTDQFGLVSEMDFQWSILTAVRTITPVNGATFNRIYP